MSKMWLGCPNCVLAFSSEGEYRRHYELDHPGRRYRRAQMVRSQGG